MQSYRIFSELLQFYEFEFRNIREFSEYRDSF